MKTTTNPWAGMVLACSALWLSAGASWAAKPDWVEQGQANGKGNDKVKVQGAKDGRDRPSSEGVSGSVHVGGPSFGVSIRFGDDHRRAVYDYYAPLVRAGKCPPGLAKKNNGCLPPGQVKAWHIGQPLPGGVVVYPLPRNLELRLGTPPAGHKYVRVAADILLIAVGTSMVVDAIEDLAGL